MTVQEARPVADGAGNRWPLGRIIAVAMVTLGVVLLAAVVIGAIALDNLGSARSRVVNVLDPAATHRALLYAAMLNQETGVRGFLLSGQHSFLGPYYAGLTSQRAQASALQPLLADMPRARADLAATLRYMDKWRTSYATPSIEGKKPAPPIALGKAAFDSVRAPLAMLQGDITGQRQLALTRLSSSVEVLDIVGIASAVALILVVLAFGVSLRAAAIAPLSRLADDARKVVSGDFEHEVDPSGPKEIHALAVDVNRMRDRILRELSAVRTANIELASRASDLERSNAELEQFAYVASHDLQEPLRKVASFCQLLQRRYIGQLDARADQYIEFAVDGAKRMQALIDDLLAFSRVGRGDRQLAPVSSASALSQARVNLTAELRKSAAVIETTELPTVLAEFSLLTSVFQNLIGNAVKFRTDEPPRIRITAERQDDWWLFSVADNGIGVPSEYADRIFVIFQRLHDRATYAGTGIGLAMCRKIVEHFGGRIWLDASYQNGAKFCFTLPVASSAEKEPPSDD